MLYLIWKHKGPLYEIKFYEDFDFSRMNLFDKSYMYAGSHLWFADALIIHPKTLPGKGTGGLYGFKFLSVLIFKIVLFTVVYVGNGIRNVIRVAPFFCMSLYILSKFSMKVQLPKKTTIFFLSFV